MSSPFHIHLDIDQKETDQFFIWLKTMGLNPQWVESVQLVKSEDIKVCPMGPSNNQIYYASLAQR